ncbi:hypothetical protein ABIB35_000600 [Arthrobacter sp. UYP6]
MKKLGITVLLAASMAFFGVAAPASAAAMDSSDIVKPLVGIWPNPR